jgi:hypothetical protein
MTCLRWSFLEAASQLLEPREREAVLGDLAEAGLPAWQGVPEVLGLFLRRQALLWTSWRPWVAAFGLTLPFSFLLMGYSLSVSETLHRLASEYANGLIGANSLLLPLCYIFLLIAWSWIGGFVVGSISPRTIWVSILACCSPCLFCLSRFREHSLSRFWLLLFLVPAIWGALRGLHAVGIKFGRAIALAAAVTVLMIWAWNAHGMGMLSWALLWPAWYVVATTRKPQAINLEKTQ